MNWDDCREAFHQDGSLRDIYVLETNETDWNEFLSFIRRRRYGSSYTRDGVGAEVPTVVAEVMADRPTAHLLAVDIGGGITINCHFFDVAEIELDLDPKEVASQSELDRVLNFMSDLGTHLSKDVILTEESNSQLVILRYQSSESQFEYHAPPQ